MNRETAKLYLPLVQALADGKVIQVLTTTGQWRDCEAPRFHPSNKYRIRPGPIVVYVNEYQNHFGSPYRDRSECIGYALSEAVRKGVRFIEAEDQQ